MTCRCLRCGSELAIAELPTHRYECPDVGEAFDEPKPIPEDPIVPTRQLALALPAYESCLEDLPEPRDGDRDGSRRRLPHSQPSQTRFLGALYRKIARFGGASA